MSQVSWAAMYAVPSMYQLSITKPKTVTTNSSGGNSQTETVTSSLGLQKMKELYSDTDGILWFNDGHMGNTLNTLCILGKKYYDRFGYIYHPEYKSVWSDNEFMLVGNILGKQTYFEQVIIEHEHPDWGYGNRDEIHQNNSKNENQDKLLFTKRKDNNFYL